MRYQDRLLKLCPAPRPLLGQFVAREMEGLVLYFDAANVLGALREMELVEADLAGTQAALALCRLAPLHHRATYLPAVTAVQSRLMDSDQLEAAGPAPTESARVARQANRETYRRAAAMLLDPLVEPLLAMAGGPSNRRRRRAIRLLAELQHRKGLQLLEQIAGSAEDPDAPLALLLSAGHCRGDGAQVLDCVRKNSSARHFPAMLLSLGAAPSPEALRVLAALTTCINVEALAGAASALEGFGPDEAEPLLERLCRDGYGWATVHALETIGRLRSPRALDLVIKTYRRLDHPTMRAAAAKVAGTLPGAEARQFLAEVVRENPESGIAARALEGLVRYAGGASEHADLFAAHAADPNPESAVAAVVGLCATDRQHVARQLRTWLVDDDPAWRAEAAYCLGYVQGDFAAGLLAKLAGGDPDPTVRLQATRSLSLFGWSPVSVAKLTPLMESPDDQIRRTAARILGHPALAEDRSVHAQMLKCYEAARESAEAAGLARAMGATGSGLAREYLSAQAVIETDAVKVAGLLDGLDLGGGGSPTVWKALLGHETPRVRAAAARAAWHAGDLSGVGVLADLLKAGEAASDEALYEAERMLTTAWCLADEPRFSALRERLRAALHSRSYQEFAAEEFSVHLSPDRLPRGYDPFADPSLARPWSDGDSAPLASSELPGQMEQARKRSRRRKRPRAEDALDALDGRISAFSPGRVTILAVLGLSMLLLLTGTFRTAARAAAQPGSRTLLPRGGTTVPAALQVVGLGGGATVDLGSGATIRALPGTTLRAGCGLRAGPQSPVILVGPSGRDRLRVLPETAFKVIDVTWDRKVGATKIALESLSGTLVAEVEAPHTDLTLATAGARVSVRKGTCLLRASAAALTAQVAEGRAEVSAGAGGPLTILTSGQDVEVSGGKPGPVGSCDPQTVLRDSGR
ncbi:MAG: HEAT repeat domain-containing protein [Candidatus Wallbacteria bacterium]|nr:HEAT repeat domain-containing protein [Candidatus Wallbacteria bacterium]